MSAPILINTVPVEVWPAQCLPDRSHPQARLYALSRWVIRHKSDHHALAAIRGNGSIIFLDRKNLQPGLLTEALRAIKLVEKRWDPDQQPLPIRTLNRRLSVIGLDARSYQRTTGLPVHQEPRALAHAGLDRYGRPVWLHPHTARAWLALRQAAATDAIRLEVISSYRSHEYQLRIITNKMARGQTLAQILQINAAPGFSEHHSGRAIDMSLAGWPAAEESFELSPAFAWLRRHAGQFGFRLSYPRHHPSGISYEPWHWCWHDPAGPLLSCR